MILTLAILSLLVSSIISMLSIVVITKFLFSRTRQFRQSMGDEAILISGCDSGIGLQLVKHFHKTTKLKIICGFLNPNHSDGFRELEEILSADHDNRLILHKLDLTSDEDVNRISTTIEQLIETGALKQLVALINNAGILNYGEFDWLTWDQIQTQVQVNLLGTLRLTRSILPFIIEAQGRIINVSSVNDATVFPGLSVYSASKSALSTFSRGLGYELRKFGVHVINVRLGDFARLTNIMLRHTENRDDMWNEMNVKKKEMYHDFFHQFNSHLMKNYGTTSPKKYEDSSLFQDFRLALLAENPPLTITCTPIGFKIFYAIIELIPVNLQYLLLDQMIRFGFRWNSPNLLGQRSSK